MTMRKWFDSFRKRWTFDPEIGAFEGITLSLVLGALLWFLIWLMLSGLFFHWLGGGAQ